MPDINAVPNDELRAELAKVTKQRDMLQRTLETRAERELEMLAEVEAEHEAALAAERAKVWAEATLAVHETPRSKYLSESGEEVVRHDRFQILKRFEQAQKATAAAGKEK